MPQDWHRRLHANATGAGAFFCRLVISFTRRGIPKQISTRSCRQKHTNLSRSRAALFARVADESFESLSRCAESKLASLDPPKLLEGLPSEASAKKGSRTPASPVRRTASFSDAATRSCERADLPAFHLRLSPAGLPVPKAQVQARLPGTRFPDGRYPRSPVPVQWRAPHAPVCNAGEHDARTRPGAECMAPPAGAAPAPPR